MAAGVWHTGAGLRLNLGNPDALLLGHAGTRGLPRRNCERGTENRYRMRVRACRGFTGLRRS